jgi:hypothetical protein
MFGQFNELARSVLRQAETIARGLNHEYIGTEHLLLAIVDEPGPDLAHSLTQLGLSAEPIRAHVEALIERGLQPTSLRKLPFTPRANQAIEFASQEAWNVHQDQIGPEHLLLGLAREPVGVAGQVLSKFNLKLDVARRDLLAFRIEQLKYVERIVRPVPAGSGCKRKMREELLTHLTTIYEEELARLKNPVSAWQSAAERFGTPAEISRELRNSLPLRERLNDFVERRLGVGWRPPETATHWMARSALHTAILLAAMNVVTAILMFAAVGANSGVWAAIRAIAAMSLCIPFLQFVLGVAFFKMRDAVFGVFGTRKSHVTAAAMAALMSLTIAATFTAFVSITSGQLAPQSQLIAIALATIATPLFVLVIIRTDGPQEIRDTLWGCLEIDPPRQPGTPPVEPA